MKRIFTSSYSKCKGGNRISISRDKGISEGFEGKVISELAPDKSFWRVWKDNRDKIPEEENTKYYIKEYYNQALKNADIIKLLENEEEPILLCYEKSEEFCHRHIVAEYINIKYGIKVQEIEVDEKGNIIFKERPENIRRLLEEVIEEQVKS